MLRVVTSENVHQSFPVNIFSWVSGALNPESNASTDSVTTVKRYSSNQNFEFIFSNFTFALYYALSCVIISAFIHLLW